MKKYIWNFARYSILLLTLLLCAGCGKTSEGDRTLVQGDVQSTPGGLLTASQWQNGFRETASVTVTDTHYYELRRSELQSPDVDFDAQAFICRTEAWCFRWEVCREVGRS